MPHPSLIEVEKVHKKEHLSPLLRAKAAAQGVTCACPFGCGPTDCDAQGYCRHLVGYTDDKKFMWPMVFDGDRYSIRAKRRPIPGQRPTNPLEGRPVAEEPVLEPVLDTDQLMQVSVSYRVYRDVDGAGQRLLEERERSKSAERRAMLKGLLEDPETKKLLLDELTRPAVASLPDAELAAV